VYSVSGKPRSSLEKYVTRYKDANRDRSSDNYRQDSDDPASAGILLGCVHLPVFGK